TPPNTTAKKPSEEEWQELWQKALNILHVTQTYLITRATLSRSPSEIDELRFILDSHRLGIRVDRYPFFLHEHLRSSLKPYESWIKEIYGIDVVEIIKGLLQIHEYLKTGIIRRYVDAINSMDELQSKLRERGYAVDPGATPEQVEETRKALEL